MLGHYKQISNYGHFYKFHNPMTYSEGVIACENINGYIIEFDERHINYMNKLRAMIEEYGKHNFYVGLTDIENEHYWKWSSSGRILAHTAHSVFDDGNIFISEYILEIRFLSTTMALVRQFTQNHSCFLLNFF